MTAPLTIPGGGPGGGGTGRKTRKASRTGAAARLPIVRAQIRLPGELNEKMPSAPNTPVNLRRECETSKLVDVRSKLAENQTRLAESAAASVKKVPKSVASMVRR